MKKTDQLQRRHSTTEGGVLLPVMLITIVLSLLGMAQLNIARLNAVEVFRLEKSEEAFTLAEIGFNEMRSILSATENYRYFEAMNLINSDGSAVYTSEVTNDAGRVIGSYEIYLRPAAPSAPRAADYELESVGISTRDQRRSSIKAYIQLATVSEDAYASNTEGNIAFATGDRIRGSIRTNQRFTIHGSPVIEGLAQSHLADVYYRDLRVYSDHENPDVFQGGIKFGTPQINFNPEIITDMKSMAGEVINGDCTIRFLEGGSYEVSQGTDITTNTIDGIGTANWTDNIIYVDGNVTVNGEVGGPVSIASSNAISIDGNLIYTSMKADANPSNWNDTLPGDNERLGLFARKKVMVINSERNEDIQIHGAMFITDPNPNTYLRGFCVEGYNSGDWNTPQINFYGSLVQNQRGAVGTSRGTGYKKNYHQDLRFRRFPPPGAPLSTPRFFEWRHEVL